MKISYDNLVELALCLRSCMIVLLCNYLFFAPAFAETIETRLPSGITAKASFNKGLPSLPAVFILHGFLQADHSTPMSSLAGNLASRGYTVLNPTITLGLHRRSQSMACEAVHTHKMEDEVAEVGYWLNWLHKKGHQEIILIGFSSTGNLALLEYIARGAHPAVKRAILANPNPISIDQQQLQKTRLISGSRAPARYSVGFCKNSFAATVESYLSYARYNESKLLDLLKNTPVQTEVILGSADSVLPANWAERIKSLNSLAHVRQIKNANHFFDGTQEFDLADEVESILKNSRPKQS